MSFGIDVPEPKEKVQYGKSPAVVRNRLSLPPGTTYEHPRHSHTRQEYAELLYRCLARSLAIMSLVMDSRSY